MKQTKYRTHTCGELRMEHVGQTVTLAGWLENLREVGSNFAFLVLRDFYGTTQVVVETQEMMDLVKPLNKESTIAVTGVVRERTSKNPKLPTGDIEVVPSEIKVLGRCRYNELPFEVNFSKDADESQRLKYRYLDLRNPPGEGEDRPAQPGGVRPAPGHGAAGLSGDHHPHPHRLLPRGGQGLPGARPEAPGEILRPAPGAPAVQAAADDLWF